MCRILYSIIVTVTLITGMFSPPARADSTTAILNKIIQGTPGITNVAISTGVRASAAGAVDVAAGGLVIPVATTVSADVGFGTIAAGAAKIGLRAVPWVGTAIVVGEIANAMRNKNVAVCPPPDFFCNVNVPDPGSLAPAIYGFGGSQITYSSAYAAGIAYAEYLRKSNNCQASSSAAYCPHIAVSNTVCTPTATNDCSSVGTNPCMETVNSWSCPTDSVNYPNLTGGKGADPKGCTAPAVLSGQYCVVSGATLPNSPATVSALQKQLTDSFNADAALALKMKQEMDDVSQANPALAPPVDVTSSPLTVTAPQVVAPAKVVSTTQLQNPDGSTSTQTVSNQTTVTPSVSSPGTPANPTFSYPSTTTVTTTTTNNTTNVSNQTTTTTVNNPVTPSKPADTPTDYNREVTQKQVLQQLDGSLIPSAPEDQAVRVKTQTESTDKSLSDTFTGIPKLFASDKVNWFSWVWTPPVGSCSASDYSGSVHGWAVSFDICPWVSKIREAIGFIFAIIGALSIYTNIFKRDE